MENRKKSLGMNVKPKKKLATREEHGCDDTYLSEVKGEKLLIAALLEELCLRQMPEERKAQELFNVSFKQLWKRQGFDSSSQVYKMRLERLEQREMLNEILKAASASLEQPCRASALTNENVQNVKPENETQGELHSRFKADFEEIESLGKGGFGTVYKARHKLDGREYAVKKIKIRNEDIEQAEIEVRILAKLEHRNIVRYFASWIEHGGSNFSSTESSDGSSTQSLCRSTEHGPKVDRKMKLFATQQNSQCFRNPVQGLEVLRDVYDSSISYDSEEEKAENVHQCFQMPTVLLIQMELCCQNLSDLLQVHKEPITKSEHKDFSAFNMMIFKQILEGVIFLHSKGIIHRDLTPRNIFISLQNGQQCVKIGDFGLAKTCELQQGLEVKHTSGIGTSFYAAPEQLEGTACNEKCDMYSLGVILYEMFSNIGPYGQERQDVLGVLRDKPICPESFSEKWPIQAHAVQSLIAKMGTTRPTAQVLRNMMFHDPKQELMKLLQNERKRSKSKLKKMCKRIKQLEKHLAKCTCGGKNQDSR